MGPVEHAHSRLSPAQQLTSSANLSDDCGSFSCFFHSVCLWDVRDAHDMVWPICPVGFKALCTSRGLGYLYYMILILNFNSYVLSNVNLIAELAKQSVNSDKAVLWKNIRHVHFDVQANTHTDMSFTGSLLCGLR